MYIRDLQSRVQFMRPDLPAGHASQALQDAARWVARRTGVVRLKVYGTVSVNQYIIDLAAFMGAAAGEFVVLRPTRIMYMPGLDRRSTSLGLLSTANPTIPLATVATAYGFYLATIALTASDGATSYAMQPGDVIQALSGKWVVSPFYKYSVAKDLSKERTYHAKSSPLNTVGYLGGYVVDKDSVSLIPVPVCAVPIQMECSIVPIKEFDNVDFPVEAEDAVIAMAKSLLYQTPNKSGGGMDLGTAEKFSRIADGEVSLLRAVAEGGYGDSEMAPPPHFGN